MTENEKIVRDMIKKMSEKAKEIDTDVGKALAKACAVVQREAQESMTNTEVDISKVYFTHNKTIGHNPSKEGFPPAVDTGTLRRSITYSVDEEEKVGRVGTVLQNPPYGVYLEFGTSRMRPRPWLKPALEKSVEKIKKIFKETLGK